MKTILIFAELFLAFCCANCSQPVIFRTIPHPDSTPNSSRNSTAGANFDHSFGQNTQNRYQFVPVPNRIVFMVDDSGSTMGRHKDPGGDPSFILRESAVADVVSQYRRLPSVLYALGKFGAGRAEFFNLCSKCLGGRRFFGSALELKTALNDYVANGHHGGDTPYLPTMFAIENLIDLDPTPSYAVVFVSDGEPTDLRTTNERQLEYELARLVRATMDFPSTRVDFNTIYFGPLPGSLDDYWYQAEDAVRRLQVMASAGHGQFYELHNK